MKVQALTSPQQTQAASLKAAVTSAQSALVAARAAFAAYLVSCLPPNAGSPPTPATLAPGQRAQLTSDGTSLVILP
jgi:hypothetical protein